MITLAFSHSATGTLEVIFRIEWQIQLFNLAKTLQLQVYGLVWKSLKSWNQDQTWQTFWKIICLNLTYDLLRFAYQIQIVHMLCTNGNNLKYAKFVQWNINQQDLRKGNIQVYVLYYPWKNSIEYKQIKLSMNEVFYFISFFKISLHFWFWSVPFTVQLKEK